MNGHDHQWRLNRHNFEGRWCGTSHWYLRGEGPGGLLDLHHPSRTIASTTYAITFSDADTGLWDGSGLLFAPEGRRQLPLTRKGYNQGGQCWQFIGAGGQSSLRVDPAQPRFGHEINLFHGRSRSMLVLLWGRADGAGGAEWRLDAVGAVPFRCSLSPDHEPPRPTPSAAALLEQPRGWPGQLESLEPGAWPHHNPTPQACDRFDPQAFACHPLTAAFADGLVCSVPEQLPNGAFALQVGCLLSPQHFTQVSLLFDAQQQLSRWELRRFRQGDGPR
jgi:hypothetical protein